MPKIYITIGSYYGGPRLDDLLYLLRRENLTDYALLVNEQKGSERKPTGFAAIYNNLLNCAFADPNCEAAWILGDDVVPQDDCLRKTMDFFTDPTVGAIFPVEAWSEEKKLVTILPFTNEKKPIADALKEGPDQVEQLFPGMACALVRRRAWEKVGPMDVSLGIGYCEDLDWGIRCWRAGYRIVNYRRAWFLHERGATYNQFVKEGLMTKEAPYEAAERAKVQWDWLWNGEPLETTFDRLHKWYEQARGEKTQ